MIDDVIGFLHLGFLFEGEGEADLADGSQLYILLSSPCPCLAKLSVYSGDIQIDDLKLGRGYHNKSLLSEIRTDL